MITKEFEQSLFDENDPISRGVVIRYFAARGLVFVDNPDKYGVDLIGVGHDYTIEVERRPVWDKDEFPFREVNAPARKAKFFNKGAAYVIVSNDCTRIGIASNTVLRVIVEAAAPKESANRYVASGEMFYKIPRDKFRWVLV